MTSASASSPPPDIEALIEELTLDEKCTMLVGQGRWVVPGCERLGIPEWCVSDGPVGVRGRHIGPGLLIPGPSALAATWNVDLVAALGEALGIECNDRRVDLLLAPTVNLHRSPRGGRHFESYSEDPELSSRICVAYINGVQGTGVGACVKHFIANDQEYERFTINVEVDERSLREIYLPPFEAAVKEAGVRSVMGAYSFVNGHHGCAQPDLIVELLKTEWGFDGFVVSDWIAIKETVAPALHGLDLEMPGPGVWWGEGKLAAAVRVGDVAESLIDDKVRRILGFLEWAGRLGTPTDHDETSTERPEHRTLSRRAATESMVLIKNEANVLPLADDNRTIALIGPGVESTALLGGGSASLVPHRTTTVAAAMADRLGDRIVGMAEGISLRRSVESVPAEHLTEPGVTFELFDGMDLDGLLIDTVTAPRPFMVWNDRNFPIVGKGLSVRVSFDYVAQEAGTHRLCAYGFGHARLFVDDTLVADNSVEGFSGGVWHRGGAGSMDLEAGHTYRMRLDCVPRKTGQRICTVDVGIEPVRDVAGQSIAEAVALAVSADVAVVVVGSSSEWESEGSDRASIDLPNRQDELVERVVAANANTVVVLNCGAPMNLSWLDDAAAAILAWYPGQEGGEAIADVLVGDSEPSGRMPTTWARDERDTPSFLNYPGEAGTVRYGEGTFVGYRWYDARAIEPRIPFGHGGSYTTIEWGDPAIEGTGTDLVVTVPLTNTGDRAGHEVVQVYVAPADHVVTRPEKELAGFAKVYLEPSESASARICLRDRSFARWDPGSHKWVIDPGEYSIVLAASVVDPRSVVTIELP